MTPKARLRPGTPDDRAAVVALVESEGLSADGIDAGLAGFVIAEEEGRVIGVAGLERYGAFGLLRSVAVAGDRRGLGLGARLTGAVIEDSRRQGLATLYALTTTAMAYFPRQGFEAIERTRVPEAVRASAEFTAMCPASAIALELRLSR
ncbi:MAG TPA: arsenic resistance N-acetyltransferase ArsN2 [Longimicrobiales bacterium]|nr:arsenic resistance N-acetyltransferase ArsN2 [Longimicrobiales bacterium]